MAKKKTQKRTTRKIIILPRNKSEMHIFIRQLLSGSCNDGLLEICEASLMGEYQEEARDCYDMIRCMLNALAIKNICKNLRNKYGNDLSSQVQNELLNELNILPHDSSFDIEHNLSTCYDSLFTARYIAALSPTELCCSQIETVAIKTIIYANRHADIQLYKDLMQACHYSNSFMDDCRKELKKLLEIETRCAVPFNDVAKQYIDEKVSQRVNLILNGKADSILGITSSCNLSKFLPEQTNKLQQIAIESTSHSMSIGRDELSFWPFIADLNSKNFFTHNTTVDQLTQQAQNLDFEKIAWGILLTWAENKYLSKTTMMIFIIRSFPCLIGFHSDYHYLYMNDEKGSIEDEIVKITSKKFIMKAHQHNWTEDALCANIGDSEVRVHTTGNNALYELCGTTFDNDIIILGDDMKKLELQGFSKQEARDYSLMAATIRASNYPNLIEKAIYNNVVLNFQKDKKLSNESKAEHDDYDEVAQMKAEVETLKSIIAQKDKDLKTLSKQASHAETENERLGKTCEELERENKELRMEMDELLDSFDNEDRLNTECDMDESSTIQFPVDVSEMHIVLMGGHPSFQNQLSQLLPGLVISHSANGKRVDTVQLRNADLVIFQVNRMGHAQYYTAIKACKNSNTPYFHLNTSNACICANQIVRYIMKLRSACRVS